MLRKLSSNYFIGWTDAQIDVAYTTWLMSLDTSKRKEIMYCMMVEEMWTNTVSSNPGEPNNAQDKARRLPGNGKERAHQVLWER